MRIALNNLNADMVKQNSDYVVRITAVTLTVRANWIISFPYLLPTP
jgi:hypothetical protein